MSTWNEIAAVLGKDKTPEEKRVISEYLSSLETARGAFSGGGTLTVENIYANTGDFKIFPSGLLYLRTNTSPTITTGVGLPIPFGTIMSDNRSYFSWDSSNPTKVYLKSSSASVILVFGSVTFTSNATGRRAVSIVRRNAVTGAHLGGTTAASIKACDTDHTTVPFLQTVDSPGDSYIEIEAHQDSGGDLDLIFCHASFMVIK